MTDMTLDEAVKWLRGHIGDLRLAAQVLRESPWGAKLADTVAAVYKAADKGTLAIAALEAAQKDGWQPIETAPDEAWFLVHSEEGWIGLARRSDPDYAPDEGWFEDEHTEFLDPEWLTHWHPLPAPPTIDRAREKGGKEDSND